MSQPYFNASRHDMVPFLPGQCRRVLEIGCAAGSFRRFVPQAQEYWGVEPSMEAAQEARNHLTRVLAGSFERVEDELPDEYFDLLVCNDVLEHMVDPPVFLDRVRRKLTRDAVLVGSLPNVFHVTLLMKLLLLKDWRYTDAGILDRTHLRFFTPKSMQRLLVEQGLEIERFQGLSSVIRKGVVGQQRFGLKDLAVRAASAGLVACTLGYWWETQYPQYGFRARFAPASSSGISPAAA